MIVVIFFSFLLLSFYLIYNLVIVFRLVFDHDPTNNTNMEMESSNFCLSDSYLSNLNDILIESNKLMENNNDSLLIENNEEIEDDTDKLLENIESMLKSMANQDDLDNKNKIQEQKKIIKAIRQRKKRNMTQTECQESTKNLYKKITPKVPVCQKPILPKSQTSIKTSHNIILNEQKNCREIFVLNSQNQQNNSGVVNVLNQVSQPQPITVLNTITPINSLPLIITNNNGNSNSTLLPNTIFIDSNNILNSPSAKRIKADSNRILPAHQTFQLDKETNQQLQINSQITSQNFMPNNQEIESELIKKQSRMIKNRESACLSRKRKKEV